MLPLFKGNSQRLSSKLTSDQIEFIYNSTKNYPKINSAKMDLKIRAYIIKNNIRDSELRCKNCKVSYVKFNSFSKGFVTYCSPRCANTSDEFITKQKATNLERYGHEYNFASDETKRKKKATNLEKYGHSNVLCSNHTKQQNLENFGTENVSQSLIIKTMIKRKNDTKFGINRSHKNYHIENYHNFNNIDFICKKFKDKDNHFKINEFMEYFKCSASIGYLKMKKLGIDYNTRVGVSEPEYEILDLLPNSIHQDSSLGIELDILSDNIAIEYNGLMWHSHGKSKYSMFNNPSPNTVRHLTKTNIVEENNFQLYQIFENEWLNPVTKQIWKSKLSNKKKIMARKCSIQEINSKIADEFNELNHLQGSCKSSIQYGLYHDNNLVSVMTFSKSRFTKEYEYELIRFCSIQNVVVVGGASRLLKHFERQIRPKNLISYANRRWSKGDLYYKLGFTHTHNSPPNYFYFKDNVKDSDKVLESRNKYQKHKLSKLLTNFDQNLTETENMYNNNYRKIYDCGNMVFVKNYEEN